MLILLHPTSSALHFFPTSFFARLDSTGPTVVAVLSPMLYRGGALFTQRKKATHSCTLFCLLDTKADGLYVELSFENLSCDIERSISSELR